MLLGADFSGLRSMLYLETGVEPIHILIKKLLILKYILDQEDASLIKRIYNEQKALPMKGDWVKNVKSDLSELKIYRLEEEIVSMTKKASKNLIKNNARNVTFKALKSKLRKKGKEIIYEGYYLQDYLKSSSGLNKQEMMDVFRLRTSTINIASFRPFKFGN